jgi:hypothetical protein
VRTNILAAACLLSFSAAAAQSPAPRPGVAPQGMSCSVTPPIRLLHDVLGEPCIHHLPGGEFYGKTRPERCYASEADP